MNVTTLMGQDMQGALPDLARLRIEVFREYPYLYDGTLAYETNYLRALIESKDSLIVAAKDEGRIVGCATGSALSGHHAEFGAPFRESGIDLDRIFYCGESILLPMYRGQGLGHSFFERREAHAKERGYWYSAFCAVIRPESHPLKPVGFSPLDAFWIKRGYKKVDGMIAMFRWKDINEADETDHPMQFWMRDLK